MKNLNKPICIGMTNRNYLKENSPYIILESCKIRDSYKQRYHCISFLAITFFPF